MVTPKLAAVWCPLVGHVERLLEERYFSDGRAPAHDESGLWSRRPALSAAQAVAKGAETAQNAASDSEACSSIACCAVTCSKASTWARAFDAEDRMVHDYQ